MSTGHRAARASDAESRHLARTEFSRPIAIEAGAGTGKTATLVARVLAWTLGPGWERAREEQPEADAPRLAERVLRCVVAITFTEAAAAEMETRVDAALAALARGERPLGFDAPAPPERVAALRGALDQLVVSTIHAYCRRLLAAFPIEAGLHPFFEVDADGEQRAATVRDVVAEQLGAAYARGAADALALAEQGTGPAELELELCAQLEAGVTAAELAADPLAPERIASLCGRLIAAHGALASAAEGRLAEVARGGKAAAVASAIARAQTALADPPHDAEGLARLLAALATAWTGTAQGALAKWKKGDFTGAERKALGARASAVGAASTELEPVLAHCARLDLERLARIAPLLARLGADAEERLRRRGVTSFEDLLSRSASLLADRPDVAARWRRGIDQLLVDEFQDTDPRQCAIVAALALDGTPEERPGLFLVGDPKQSIYGWRNADLAAYEALLGRLREAGGVVGSLCVNHRSVPEILAEVERVIRPVMRREPGLQPGFEALVPSAEHEAAVGFDAGGRAPVEFWVSAECDADRALMGTRAAEAARLEARALARDLRELHDDHGVGWRDVGVLFRSRGEWDVYLGALREAGIPYAVEGDRTYYRRREILDAAGLVCAVLDPNDALSLVALLRSSAAGVPDAAWLPLWQEGLPGLAARLGVGDDAAARAGIAPLLERAAAGLTERVPGVARVHSWPIAAAAALEAVAALRRSFAHDPGDVFVEKLRAGLCFEATEAARFLGAWRAANLERFFADLAESLASGEPVAPLLRRIRRAVAEEESPSAEPAAPAAADAVTVATLHGAKGLDWQHVYLMQLHKGEARAGRPGEVGREDGALEAEWCRCPTLGHDLVTARRRRVADAERVRLLYVGMTRARSRLVLCGLWPAFQERGGDSHATLLAQRDPAPPAFAALAGGASGGRAVAARAQWLFPALWSERAAARADDASASDAPIPRAPAAPPLAVAAPRAADDRMRWRIGASVSERIAAAESEPGAGAWGGGDAVLARPLARAVGTAVHAALERLDLSGDPARAWGAGREELAARLRRELVPPLRERAEADALACWDTLASGPLAARLRVLAARVVARELPVLLAPETLPDRGAVLAPVAGFVTGSIDLLYRDERGGLVVVDYKTGRPAEGAEAAAQRARHAHQGALYCHAVSEALAVPDGVPPRFEIWWLRTGVVEPLDVRGPVGAGAAPPS